ncbi:MAG: isoprenylcysteine carboxylmethyltransferase family protein [Anaerolineae bacterium]|nr:isoprenylcysteine carboxylmethyltransferase family protein [Anaerolineae bacterium]
MLERRVRQAGAIAVFLTLAAIFTGIWRGLRQPVIARTGRFANWLRRPLFYLFASTGYYALCWRLWRPFPWALSGRFRAVFLTLGSLLYFPGLALVLWGRLELGRMYNVSSSFGAHLYAGHRLVTSGPFAYVRHPMYLGILLTALGGIALYRTWTFLFLLTHFPVLMVRARHEEQALAATFGTEWDAYCRQAPRWLPRCKER